MLSNSSGPGLGVSGVVMVMAFGCKRKTHGDFSPFSVRINCFISALFTFSKIRKSIDQEKYFSVKMIKLF